MAIKKKTTISWSGGKDAAFALYKILLAGELDVVSLHTTINSGTKRVGMHGVPEVLIDKQAEALGLPIRKLYLDPSETHAAYEELITAYYRECAKAGIDTVVFGDIFLEDLKNFRESMLSRCNIEGLFPLWRLDTRMLIDDFINAGFKTLICSADAEYFNINDVGRTLNRNFLDALPPGVDPCGENGEFHTFVYDGPLFRKPLAYRLGEAVSKKYTFQIINDNGEHVTRESAFWFQDIVPVD